MEKTHLFDVICKKKLFKKIGAYEFGVEVGLDSHRRKNRSGKIMENRVYEDIVASGFVENKTFFCQKKLRDVCAELNIDISNLNHNSRLYKKAPDFIIKGQNYIYIVECNYYSKTGSKPLEVVTAYQKLQEQIRSIGNLKFIWITDGQGWKEMKNAIEESWNSFDAIYNLYLI